MTFIVHTCSPRRAEENGPLALQIVCQDTHHNTTLSFLLRGKCGIVEYMGHRATPELVPLSKDCVDSSPWCRQLEKKAAMARISAEKLAAALKAGLPLRSDDYPDNDRAWHDGRCAGRVARGARRMAATDKASTTERQEEAQGLRCPEQEGNAAR